MTAHLPPARLVRRDRPRRCRAVMAAALLVLAARPASAASALEDEAAGDDSMAALAPSRLNAGTDGAGFPEPFWLSLLTVVGAGAAGAAAAGRLAGRRGRSGEGWAARALPVVTVGSTAAVVALTLNPPGGAWWSLAATAAAAGLGAEGLTIAARRRRRRNVGRRARAAPRPGGETETGTASRRQARPRPADAEAVPIQQHHPASTTREDTMADLRKHIAPDARTSGKFDVFVARVKVGHGEYLAVEPLRLRVRGEVSSLGLKGEVEVIMPDASPAGRCTVVLNGARFDDCPYRTDGIALVIDTPPTQVVMQDHDRSYSWVQAKGIWAGLWTTSAVFSDEFLADAPSAEVGEPAAAGD